MPTLLGPRAHWEAIGYQCRLEFALHSDNNIFPLCQSCRLAVCSEFISLLLLFRFAFIACLFARECCRHAVIGNSQSRYESATNIYLLSRRLMQLGLEQFKTNSPLRKFASSSVRCVSPLVRIDMFVSAHVARLTPLFLSLCLSGLCDYRNARRSLLSCVCSLTRRSRGVRVNTLSDNSNNDGSVQECLARAPCNALRKRAQ